MELLQFLVPSTRNLRIDSYAIVSEDHRLRINLTSIQSTAFCPICTQPSHRIHSRYERTLTDLPCVSVGLSIVIRVCKFFRINSACYRRISIERLPEVAAPWSRKTQRLVERLQAVALALDGQAGARLYANLRSPCCGSTLLNHLKRLPLTTFNTPTVLGVDDFAFRKGQYYGTILIDLETHQPIALLADRKAETLVEWLQAHPGIEILSRDRSKTYKCAMSEGASNAIQVADRFHLVKTLGESAGKGNHFSSDYQKLGRPK